MIYCLWYPSGGFGHYINSVITLYGDKFLKPKKIDVAFSPNGNSHNSGLVAPKYCHDPESYTFHFDTTLNYVVLVDNGINNEGEKFKSFFPNSTIIKIGYSDYSWPIIAQTMIVKAIGNTFDSEVYVSPDHWNTSEPWALREKYFLYLKDHYLRHQWRANSELFIDINELLDYQQLKNKLLQFGIVTKNFKQQHLNFLESNRVYFNPVRTSQDILSKLKENIILDVHDTWTQAVVYYFIWLTYGIEVPHNDYSNWFTSTNDIVTMLANHGVDIDSN